MKINWVFDMIHHVCKKHVDGERVLSTCDFNIQLLLWMLNSTKISQFLLFNEIGLFIVYLIGMGNNLNLLFYLETEYLYYQWVKFYTDFNKMRIIFRLVKRCTLSLIELIGEGVWKSSPTGKFVVQHFLSLIMIGLQH